MSMSEETRNRSERANLVRNVEVAASLGLELVERDALSNVDQCHLARSTVDIERSEISDNHADSAGTSEGERTLLNNLGLAVF